LWIKEVAEGDFWKIFDFRQYVDVAGWAILGKINEKEFHR